MTIRKYFLISFLVLCFVFSNSLICASEKPEIVAAPLTTVQLTDSEQAWLQQNPIIKVANEMDWPPFDYNEIGVPKGLSIDYIKLLAGKVGFEIKFVYGHTWPELVQLFKQKKLDILPAFYRNIDREEFTLFTAPYYKGKLGVFVRSLDSSIQSNGDMVGKRIGIQTAHGSIGMIKQMIPGIKFVQMDSNGQLVQALATHKLDAIIGNPFLFYYFAKEYQITNIRRIDFIQMNKEQQLASSLHIGVRKDRPSLHALLVKAMTSVSDQEMRTMENKWILQTPVAVGQIEFNKEEASWIRAHPVIHVGIMEAWPPMDFVDDFGKPQGIGVDFIELINKRLGGRLAIVPGPWKDIYDRVKHKQLDALMGITPRENRKPYFNFTRPYSTIPHVIVARKDVPYHSSLEELSGKTVALEKGFFIISHLRENHPDIRIKEYAATGDALDAVSKREADAYVGNRAVASYLMEKELLNNLQIQGKIKATVSINSIGVRKDWPELAAILDRALISLTRNEVRAIYRKWGGIGDNEKLGLEWISLAPEEKAWIKDHPVIRVAADSGWAPVEFVDEDGELKGVSIDYLKRISKKLGVELQFKKDVTWQEAVHMLRRRELDIFSAVAETPERKTFASFTKPYLSFPVSVFTKGDVPYISNLGELAGRKVAVIQGYAVAEFLKREYPQIEIVEVQNVADALVRLQSEKVFAYLGSILITSHYIRKGGHTNLKVAGQTTFKYELAMAARSDWPILTGLLQKALDAIDEEERNAIFRKWIAATYEQRVDYSLIWKVVLGALLLFTVFLFWNRRLSNEVSKRRRAEEALEKYSEQLEQRVSERTHQLRESEEKYRTIIEDIEDGYYEVDLTGNFTFFNDSMCKIGGYPKNELMGMNYRQYTDEEAAEKIYQNYNKIHTTGKPTKGFEWRVIRKDGSEGHMETSISLINDIGGKPIGFRGIARDITERKRGEEKLKKAYEKVEAKVEERTKSLKQEAEKLARMNKLFVDRELRMKELKEEIKKLKRKM